MNASKIGMYLALFIAGFYVALKKPSLFASIPLVGSVLS